MAREMRDSGIPWIGEIPVEWNVIRNKRLFTEINDRCENGDDYTLLSVSEYSGITPRSEIIAEGEFETHAASLDGYKICETGDIVMNIMLAWKRATARSDYSGIVSPAYCVYRANGDINSKYYHYLFRTDGCADMFKRYSTGIIDSRLRLYPNVFLSLSSIVPTLDEQWRIVCFLDSECARIDSVIDQTRASIEEYKKLKQAVVTQAVTKGIRPGRKMKESGVEWIGDIPEDWCVMSFTKSISGIVDYRGKTPEKQDEGILLITARNIKDGKIDYEISREYVKTEEYDEIMHRGRVSIGDVLFTTEAPLGAVANADRDDFALAQRIIKIRGQEDKLDNYFLKYWIMSSCFQQNLATFATGSTATGIKASKLGMLKQVLPPVEEQKSIVLYLDKQMVKIDKLMKQKNNLLIELESYKKSLIYEYVTGKKEVPA